MHAPTRAPRSPIAPLLLAALLLSLPAAAPRAAPAGEVFDGCTALAVGRLATVDGSVMASHTCDGHDGRTWIDVVPARRHEPGARCEILLKTDLRAAPGDTAGTVPRGTIPQAAATHGYLYGFYPLMNDRQLAISESTFGGKEELRSEAGLLDCYELTRLLAERCGTAREAVSLAGELLDAHGWNDKGECLVLADPGEAWVMEIVGPGAGKVGAVWAARRLPDDHVTVNANASRIRELDLSDPEWCRASEGVFDTARELGLWDPASGEPFEFCYAYGKRTSLSSRRREWRVFDLLAPSLQLDPNAENFPFSVRPDTLVSVRDIMRIYADTYEDTPFDMTQFMLVEGEDGRLVKSPYANPFMHYDQMPLWKINGGWGRRGERTIARYYCVYAFVAQCRDWLPDPVGGLVWFGWDNPAMTCYTPLYCGITALPDAYRRGGPDGGRPAYTRESAWWAFNRASTLAAHRWGDMRHDVAAVRDPLHAAAFAQRAELEAEAVRLHAADPQRARAYLTEHCVREAERVTAAYWQLGDHLWTAYDERF